MKLVDISNIIYQNLGTPTYTSIPSIAFWIRGKVGYLNNLLYECIDLDPITNEITKQGGEVPFEILVVIEQLYIIYDYSVQIRNNMANLAKNGLLKIEEQGTMYTRINLNSVSQTLAQIRRDEIKLLNDLVTAYRIRSSEPSQSSGDDIFGGYFSEYLQYYPAYGLSFRRL